MKRFLPSIILCCVCVYPALAQQVLGEETKEPLIRQADAVWSRKVWRIIDLREKMNQFFYNPPHPVGEHKNLLIILQESIMAFRISVYDPNFDDFKVKLTAQEVEKIWTDKITRTYEKPYPPYDQYDSTSYRTFDPRTVKKIRLKEEWYYNKSSGNMEVKIIGFCPMKEQFDDNGIFVGYADMFWIYFPEFRYILMKEEIVKPIKVDTMNIVTFDDVFRFRYFASFIYKEDNVFDRKVEDYTKFGLDNILESDQMREQIRESEDALWGE